MVVVDSCLKVLNISHCQFGDEHTASLIDVVVKNLTSLEIFHAESTALFSIDNAREILETRISKNKLYPQIGVLHLFGLISWKNINTLTLENILKLMWKGSS